MILSLNLDKIIKNLLQRMKQSTNPLVYTFYCLKEQPWYIFLLLFLDPVCTATFTVLPQYILKNIIRGFSLAVSYEHLLSLIYKDIFIYFLFFIFSFLVWRFYDYYIDVKSFPELKKNIIVSVFFYSIQQTKSFFQNNFSGDVAEKIDDLQKNVVLFIKWFFSRMLFNIISILSIAICLLYFNFYCGLITSSWILGMVIMSLFLANKISYVAIEWVNASSRLNGIFVDIFSNALIVKFFHNYIKEKYIVSGEAEKIKGYDSQINYYFFIAWLIYSFTFMIVQVSSFYVLIQQFKFSLINGSEFAFVWGMNTALVNVLWRILRDLTTLPEYYFSIKESLLILFKNIDIVDGEKNLSDEDFFSGKVTFDHVCFSFDNQNNIFNDLSLVVESGQKVALVGHSGSGKTTFLNLLLRLYDPQSGSVMINGNNIRDISLAHLYRYISVIPQDSGLFYRSVKDNIMYVYQEDRKDIDKHTFDEVLDFALLKDFVEGLPLKEDTIIGERGSTISGGQRQRVAIARAFLKNAPILILDEATSNLDSIAESKIQQNLEQIMKNKTVFIVAHRLSTIKTVDRVLVFDKGRIVQDGTHQELLEQKGLYRELWQMQSNMIQDIKEEC